MRIEYAFIRHILIVVVCCSCVLLTEPFTPWSPTAKDFLSISNSASAEKNIAHVVEDEVEKSEMSIRDVIENIDPSSIATETKDRRVSTQEHNPAVNDNYHSTLLKEILKAIKRTLKKPRHRDHKGMTSKILKTVTNITNKAEPEITSLPVLQEKSISKMRKQISVNEMSDEEEIVAENCLAAISHYMMRLPLVKFPPL